MRTPTPDPVETFRALQRKVEIAYKELERAGHTDMGVLTESMARRFHGVVANLYRLNLVLSATLAEYERIR